MGLCRQKKKSEKAHACEAKAAAAARENLHTDVWFPMVHGSPKFPHPPRKMRGSLDGIGEISTVEGTRQEKARSEVAIWRMPIVGELPDHVLYGSVIIMK